jgi:NHS family xanthosine MFS transporter
MSHSGGLRFGTVFISLAPYCLPLFTYPLLFLRELGATNSLYIFDIMIGVVTAFHIGCFRRQIGLHQTDITGVGVFRSALFIVAMWIVDLTGWKESSFQLNFSAILGIALGLYCMTLPSCEVNRNVKTTSWIDTLGLRAFALFKDKKMAIFFLFSMMLGMSLQITNAFADGYIVSFENVAEYADSFFVKHSTILISLSQISETLCILLIPFCLKRFGIKNVMLISMFAWVLRFGLLGAGNPGAGVWMFILSMIVYGVAFDFFNISGSLYVEKETAPEIRASAQGVFMIMTNGFGAFIGSYVAGWVVEKWAWPNSWYIFAGYALVVAILFALVFKYKHNPQENLKVNH